MILSKEILLCTEKYTIFLEFTFIFLRISHNCKQRCLTYSTERRKVYNLATLTQKVSISHFTNPSWSFQQVSLRSVTTLAIDTTYDITVYKYKR